MKTALRFAQRGPIVPSIIMKKFLTALFCATALASALSAADGFNRAAVVEQLDTCEAILQNIQGNLRTAIPADILRRAKGIVIVNQFQAGFILGIKDGYAVALVRRPNGKWSVPAFLRAAEFSFGLQAGGKSINAVYVLMDEATARLLFKTRMNLGAEAKVVAGIRAAERESMTQSIPTEANVLVYSASRGFISGPPSRPATCRPMTGPTACFTTAITACPSCCSATGSPPRRKPASSWTT